MNSPSSIFKTRFLREQLHPSLGSGLGLLIWWAVSTVIRFLRARHLLHLLAGFKRWLDDSSLWKMPSSGCHCAAIAQQAIWGSCQEITTKCWHASGFSYTYIMETESPSRLFFLNLIPSSSRYQQVPHPGRHVKPFWAVKMINEVISHVNIF